MDKTGGSKAPLRHRAASFVPLGGSRVPQIYAPPSSSWQEQYGTIITDSSPLYARRSAAGWTSSLGVPRIDFSLGIYEPYRSNVSNYDGQVWEPYIAYVNLIEILAMSYRKSKNSDQALSVLAEARAESFAIPSAGLYRKVMDFVEGSGFSEKKLMQRVESYASADPAPEMKFAEWIGHDPIPLERLRGRVVLLDFWATWCGPCIATFPRLRSWHKKYGGDNFIIVGVTQYYGQQDGKRMTTLQELDFLNTFKEKYKLPYPFAIVAETEAPMKYGISAYPTTVLLDRRGVVRYIGIGAGLEESENLEDMIKKVIGEDRNLAVTRAFFGTETTRPFVFQDTADTPDEL